MYICSRYLYNGGFTMLNYEKIFRAKEHYITIPQRHTRKLYFGNDHLNKILSHQKSDENMFITKYAEDGIVSCIILDLDSEDNHKLAYKDANRLRKWTNRHDLNTVIISSTNKGYHVYVQMPPRAFGEEKMSFGVDRDIWFNKFVEFIINKRKFKYPTLDATNTSAGLRGNIRVIGSLHPKTQERVHIVKGEFLDVIEPNDFEWDCLQRSYAFAESQPLVDEANRREKLRELRNRKLDGQEMIDKHDLRTIMPSIFGGEYKSFKKGYIMMQCPFHNDSNPSMVITKDYYYCKSDSCNAKGNWWTLYKLGYVKLPKEEFVRVGTLEKIKI